jgi:hypothetical protein
VSEGVSAGIRVIGRFILSCWGSQLGIAAVRTVRDAPRRVTQLHRFDARFKALAIPTRKPEPLRQLSMSSSPDTLARVIELIEP